jgi:hypothetical protein
MEQPLLQQLPRQKILLIRVQMPSQIEPRIGLMGGAVEARIVILHLIIARDAFPGEEIVNQCELRTGAMFVQTWLRAVRIVGQLGSRTLDRKQTQFGLS